MQFNILVAISLAFASQAFGQSKPACKAMGNSPVKNCGKSTDILQIDEIKLTPSKPKPGQKATVYFRGRLTEDIKKGSKVKFGAKRNDVALISRDGDLCQLLVDNKSKILCPIKKQSFNHTETIEIPKSIPPGKYSLEASGTQGKKQIFNIQIDAAF